VGQAATIVFVTPPGANILGALVDDRITFITSLNRVEIQVQNLELNIRLETQAVAAIDWRGEPGKTARSRHRFQ